MMGYCVDCEFHFSAEETFNGGIRMNVHFCSYNSPRPRNPVTGKPIKKGSELCRDRNGDGQCTDFRRRRETR